MSVTFPEPAEERDAQPQPQPETETGEREPECSELDDDALFGLDEVKRPESHINLY
jgi:hypothetical protein